MSNQVYSNQTAKYYELPGLNEYFFRNNFLVQHQESYPVDFLVQNPDTENFTNILEPGVFGMTILKSGMYNFNSSIAYRDLDLEPTNVEYAMLIDRAPQFTDLSIVRKKINSPALPSLDFNMYNYINISFTTYLRQNDFIKFIFINNSNVGQLVIYHDRSNLTVSKIN